MSRQVCVIVFVLLMGLVIAAPLQAQSMVELPAPTGSYAVGRADFTLVDPSRQETFTTDRKAQRQVAMRLYYPAAGQPGAATPFAQGLEVDVLGLYLPYPPDVIASDLRAHATTDAPLSDAEKAYPVVVFSGDLDTAALYYTSLLEDIASHGYIVVAISHPYSSLFTILSDGQVAFSVAGADQDTAKNAAGRDAVGTVWTADTAFVLQQLGDLNKGNTRFAKRLDLTHVVQMGHGFGGGVALSSALDRGFSGSISLDGRVFSGLTDKTLTQPLLLLDPGQNKRRPADEDTALNQIRNKSAGTVYSVQVAGADGASFVTDVGRLNSVFAPSKDSAAAVSEVSAVRTYVVGFLDIYLKNQQSPVLDAAQAANGISIEIHSGP